MFRAVPFVLAICATIHFVSMATFLIEMDRVESDSDFFDSNDEIDYYSNNILEYGETNDVGQTLYASQSVGKSKRFYFIAGERQDGDKVLGHVAKQTGWHTKTNVDVNISFPVDKKPGPILSYVFLVVYQESDENRINIVGGGIGQSNIELRIRANDTRYLTYNATFYGV